MPRHLERNDGMKQYPDSTRRRGRPLRNPSQDERTPEEVSWWNKNVSDPTRAASSSSKISTQKKEKTICQLKPNIVSIHIHQRQLPE
jgi:hypothetical protein